MAWQVGLRLCRLEVELVWAVCGLPLEDLGAWQAARVLASFAIELASAAQLPLLENLESSLQRVVEQIQVSYEQLEREPGIHDQSFSPSAPPWIVNGLGNAEGLRNLCQARELSPCLELSKLGPHIWKLRQALEGVVLSLGEGCNKFYLAGRQVGGLLHHLCGGLNDDEVERIALEIPILLGLTDTNPVEDTTGCGPTSPKLANTGPLISALPQVAWKAAMAEVPLKERQPYAQWIRPTLELLGPMYALDLRVQSSLLEYDFGLGVGHYSGVEINYDKLTPIAWRILFHVVKAHPNPVTWQQLKGATGCVTFAQQYHHLERFGKAIRLVADGLVDPAKKADAGALAKGLFFKKDGESFHLGVDPSVIQFKGKPSPAH